MKQRVKVFCESQERLEAKINKWVEEMGENLEIHSMNTAPSITAMGGNGMVVIFLYSSP